MEKCSTRFGRIVAGTHLGRALACAATFFALAVPGLAQAQQWVPYARTVSSKPYQALPIGNQPVQVLPYVSGSGTGDGGYADAKLPFTVKFFG